MIRRIRDYFCRFANTTARWSGSPWVFLTAVFIVLLWAVTGPLFDYSDTWQLVINTGTTIVTFLMVFLIQNTQNRDTHAIQLKLDELIAAIDEARNDVLDIEELDEERLERLRRRYKKLAEEARQRL